MVTMGTSNTKKKRLHMLPDCCQITPFGWVGQLVDIWKEEQSVLPVCWEIGRVVFILQVFDQVLYCPLHGRLVKCTIFRGPQGAAMQLLINFIICQERFCDPTSLKWASLRWGKVSFIFCVHRRRQPDIRITGTRTNELGYVCRYKRQEVELGWKTV